VSPVSLFCGFESRQEGQSEYRLVGRASRNDEVERPTQSFQCWHFGHVRNNCSSSIDRTIHCFKCGDADHMSYDCTKNPFCVICADLDQETGHRLGSAGCAGLTGRLNNNLQVSANKPE